MRTSCAFAAAMAAVFVCAMCSRSDAQMSEIIRHQRCSNFGRMDGPNRWHTALGAQSRTCKGSGIKHVVHQVPVGLQRSRIMVTWAVLPTRGQRVAAMQSPHPSTNNTTGQSGAGGQSPVNMAAAENTWQEDEDMQHAPSSPGEDSEMAQATAHLPCAGGLGGPRQGRLVLAGEQGRHAWPNTFDVGSIFEHGFKFTAVAGFTASHHAA